MELTSRVRSERVSGGKEPKTWSNKEAATISTMRVKLMVKRLMQVNSLRRSSTLRAIFV